MSGASIDPALDWLLIVNEQHARYAIAEFLEHYNHERPHYGLDLNSPIENSVVPLSPDRCLKRKDRLGGLIHEYDTVAA